MKNRHLVIFTILFFAGILLAACNMQLMTVGLFWAFVCGAYCLKNRRLQICVIVLFVILLGVARMSLSQSRRNSIISTYGGETLKVTLTATDFSDDNKVVAYFNDKSGKIKVYLSIGEDVSLSPGDIIEGELSFSKKFMDKRFNSFLNNLASEGVCLQASADSVQYKGRLKSGVYGKIYSVRRYIDSLGEEHFSGDGRALFNAMILGDKRLISDGLYRALQGSGLNHIAVVSGMHLTIAIALVMFFVKRLFGKLRTGNVVAILSAVFVTFATGCGISVVRALIMCTVFYLAGIFHRENDSMTSLFTAVLIMMVVNPYIIFSVGLIMSFFAVLGILLFGNPTTEFFARVSPSRVAQTVSLTVSAHLLLIPVIIYFFGVITPYAPLSNLFAVPLSGIYVIVGMLMIVLSPMGFTSTVFTPVMNSLAQGITAICFNFGKLPHAIIKYESNALIYVVIWLFLIILIYKKQQNTENKLWRHSYDRQNRRKKSGNGSA